MADMLFSEATDIKELAKVLIEGEEEFAPLREANVVYIYRDKSQKKNGKVVSASASTVGGKNAFLYWHAMRANNRGKFFLITVDETLYKKLEADQQTWLLRHCLRYCHFSVKKGVKRYALRAPDFELFAADIRDPAVQEVCLVIEAVKSAQLRLDMQ